MITRLLLTPHLGASSHAAAEKNDEQNVSFIQCPPTKIIGIYLLNKSLLLGRKR